MEEARARQLLTAERARVEELLRESTEAGQQDRGGAEGAGDIEDRAEPLTSEEGADAVAAALGDRLAAIGRAEARLREGTFGRSVTSNTPIPDDRLEADIAAELTVEEQAALEATGG
jgi:DnaK suppressor protein